MAPKLTVRFAAGQFGSAGDAAHTVERSSSKAARGCEQLPRALPDAAAAPVLAFEQGAGQPAQGEAPEAITSSRAAAGVSAPSESDPRRATRCVARRVRPSGPTNAAEILAASTNDDLQQTRSLVAATQLRMERLPAAPSPQLISLDAAADGAAEPPSTTARRPTPLSNSPPSHQQLPPLFRPAAPAEFADPTALLLHRARSSPHPTIPITASLTQPLPASPRPNTPDPPIPPFLRQFPTSHPSSSATPPPANAALPAPLLLEGASQPPYQAIPHLNFSAPPPQPSP